VARSRVPGAGLGKEFRTAALTLGFDGLGAEFALTGMWHDNHASLGVTDIARLRVRGPPPGAAAHGADELLGYRMTRAHWETIRRDDITLHGLERARAFLGIGATAG
jgi:hypothetical protein